MDKNMMDKIIFYLMMGTFFVAVITSVYVFKSIHEVSFNMGVIAEKVGTLEELTPLKVGI